MFKIHAFLLPFLAITFENSYIYIKITTHTNNTFLLNLNIFENMKFKVCDSCDPICMTTSTDWRPRPWHLIFNPNAFNKASSAQSDNFDKKFLQNSKLKKKKNRCTPTYFQPILVFSWHPNHLQMKRSRVHCTVKCF